MQLHMPYYKLIKVNLIQKLVVWAFVFEVDIKSHSLEIEPNTRFVSNFSYLSSIVM